MKAMPRPMLVTRRNIGHSAKTRNQAAGVRLCTTANKAMRTARKTGPRGEAALRCRHPAPRRISGRPATRYQGSIAASAALAATLDGAVSRVASTIATVKAYTTA